VARKLGLEGWINPPYPLLNLPVAIAQYSDNRSP
jgi:hypothetical protein